MNITLYTTNTPENHLNKSLGNSRSINGTVRNRTNNDRMNPVFLVSGNISGYNYAYVDGRYYYIRDVVRNINGLTELHMHEDVLMTHRGTIIGTTAHITRRVNGNTYLTDDEFTSFGNKKLGMYKFGGSFDKSGHYVLVTAGG